MAKAECKICGVEYDVCAFCPNTANITPWRRLCDTSEHFKLFMLLSDYSGKVITKEYAKEMLNELGVTAESVSSFREPVKNMVYEILDFKKSKRRQSRKAVKNVVSETVENTEPIQDEDISNVTTDENESIPQSV